MEALPAGRGWLDLGVRASALAGVEVYGEVGHRLSETWSLFGSGYLAPGDFGGMVGVRGRW